MNKQESNPSVLCRFWPELLLAIAFLLSTGGALWFHLQVGGGTLFRTGTAPDQGMSNWAWFWWGGGVGAPETLQWWRGFGPTWWGLFVLPLLAYVIIRVICTMWRHRTKT